MLSNTKITALIYLTAVFLFITDRLLKFFSLHGFFKDFDGEWLKLSFAPNPYIAFSIPISGLILSLFIGFALIFLLYFFFFLIKSKEYLYSSLVFTVFLGAASNFGDRLKLGFVVDYIDLKYFTIFNLADAMIVFGVFLIIILNIKRKK
jgi:signal peptidase II